MNRLELLKKFLPGLIPLLVFVLVDALWDTRIALVIAVATGILYFIYFRIRYKQYDKFILLDTALLVVLGGISWWLQDDIFFKLKPALVELILCVFLGISAFTPNNLLLKMTGRYMTGMKFNPYMARKIKRSSVFLFWIILFHTILIVVAAYSWSDSVWAFVSGVLFYILFALYFLYEYFNNKRLAKQEWLPLVNQKGEVIGSAPRSECHKGPGLLHPVVHLHVFNAKGELFLQKRKENKKVQPGKWDTSVGGHISLGDTVEQGLIREAKEELGLKNVKPVPLFQYVWETSIESEMVYSFACRYDKPIHWDSSEISDGRFWSLDEIRKNLNQGIFTPNFIKEFEMLEKVGWGV